MSYSKGKILKRILMHQNHTPSRDYLSQGLTWNLEVDYEDIQNTKSDFSLKYRQAQLED